ncbi:MAG TPA: DUF1616 domain-containing protein [Methanocella sp.]|nr:DUF1616 domain-containing protein [Methanocella sp.]
MAGEDLHQGPRVKLPASAGVRGFFVDMAPDLQLVLLLTAAAVVSTYVQPINGTALKPLLALVLMFFLSGYAVTAALFPRKSDVDGLERAGLALGLSVGMAGLIALGMNYTPFGIRLDPVIAGVTIITASCAFIANKRRRALPVEERFSIGFVGRLREASGRLFPARRGRLYNALVLILLVSAAGSICLAAYAVAFPHNGERYSGLYVLGPDGTMENYPELFVRGEQKPVVVGVQNYEGRTTTYDLLITLNGSDRTSRLYEETVTLDDGKTWEKTVQLKPDIAGLGLKMTFQLFVADDPAAATPREETYLWVNVAE